MAAVGPCLYTPHLSRHSCYARLTRSGFISHNAATGVAGWARTLHTLVRNKTNNLCFFQMLGSPCAFCARALSNLYRPQAKPPACLHKK